MAPEVIKEGRSDSNFSVSDRSSFKVESCSGSFRKSELSVNNFFRSKMLAKKVMSLKNRKISQMIQKVGRKIDNARVIAKQSKFGR